jgi:aminoglycoside phosphotransferase (APT) family kinase protein
MSGGFWAELVALSLTNPPAGWPAEVVARIMPDPITARKETIVQRGVAAAGFPTPRVHASGDAKAGLGRPFMVMDRAPGAPLLGGLNGREALTSALSLFRRIPEVLASSMAELHRLDPGPIRVELEQVHNLPVRVDELLNFLGVAAAYYGRSDLVEAARWLTRHPPPPAPEVICHGDLHPFNVLVDGDRSTVLDWSSALLASRAHDLAFTSLLLAEPPLRVPDVLRPVVRGAGAALAQRFIRRYRKLGNISVPADQVRWHQGVVALRALVEVAGWEHNQTAHTHPGHPWFVCGPAFARRVSRLTGSAVYARSG